MEEGVTYWPNFGLPYKNVVNETHVFAQKHKLHEDLSGKEVSYIGPFLGC